MDESSDAAPRASLRDSLAAERTYLAWLRTGIASMAFGFVVARFGLFLQEARPSQQATPLRAYGLSLWFGTALIGVGVVLCLLATWHHFRLVRALHRGVNAPARPSIQAAWFGLFLVLVGVAMAVYLVSIRASVSGRPEEPEGGHMALSSDKGIVDLASNHNVDQTVERLEGLLRAKGVTLFALVDHSGEAAKVGMRMPPTKLLIFGSPKAGTPLMLAAPSVAIDLPLKILVWEDAGGKAWISYNSPAYLMARHDLPQPLLANIAVVEALAAKAAE
jgi:uncharacterized protein (DUF302 family)/uncharacterized membrane protein YidH (DUF202 family)